MKNQEIKTAHDLQNIVENWVNQFNFIQLSVLEKMADNMLFEYIRPLDTDFSEFLNNYSLHDEYQIYLNENEEKDTQETQISFCENHSSFDSYQADRENENYPMWNTCFEFKHTESEETIQAAINAGFGVIEGLEDFNTILFVSGCGYSFYSAHWIPLFLSLPWNSDIKKQVEDNNINYQGL